MRSWTPDETPWSFLVPLTNPAGTFFAGRAPLAVDGPGAVASGCCWGVSTAAAAPVPGFSLFAHAGLGSSRTVLVGAATGDGAGAGAGAGEERAAGAGEGAGTGRAASWTGLLDGAVAFAVLGVSAAAALAAEAFEAAGSSVDCIATVFSTPLPQQGIFVCLSI